MKKLKENNKNKQFRLRAKKLFLTYSQINLKNKENIEKLIIEQLEQKVPKIIQYIIAEEEHKDGGIHYHIYLEFNQRVELYGANCLDLELEGKNYHGSYETIRKKDSAIRYIVKTGKFIAKPELPYLDGELYLDFKEYLVKLHEKSGIRGVKDHLIANPMLMVKGGPNLLKNNDTNKAVLSRYFILNINKTLFKDNVEIDVRIKIRDKKREKYVYQHNKKILKELNKNNNYFPIIN